MDPSALAIYNALKELLMDSINPVLAAMGADPLPASAFPDEVTGDPSADTILAAWSGTRRHEEEYAHRDQDELFTINIWAVGSGAMLRAMHIAAAVVSVLDQDEQERKQGGQDTYLAGTCTQPVSVGHTRCVTDGDPNAPNMIWHLAFPVLCPARTTRPEITAGE